jgi:hypothetical protein
VDNIIVQCAEAINRDGLDTEGIFRLAGRAILALGWRKGSASRIRKLRAALNGGRVNFSTPESYENDIHSVANLMKVSACALSAFYQ